VSAPAANTWELLERAVAAAGEREALVCGGERLDWRTVRRRALQRAGELARAGVRPGDRVALLDRNSAAYVELTFAVAALGAVLVPLNHRLATPELAFCIADSEARVLVADRDFAAAADAARGTAQLHWTEGDGEAEALADGLRPTARDATGAPAFLYYTSGTTGRAKGVVLTHGNVCAHADAAVAELGLAAGTRWAHVAPMFHLADAWATLALTQVGGVHVVAPTFEPRAVLELFVRERVALTNLVPTMLARLVDEGGPRAFPDLERILSGGAPIAPELVARIVSRFGCEYVQTYGMTETSPFLTMSLLDERQRALPEAEALRLRCRTGRPFRGVELEVVDESGQPIPADDESVGEIRVRGASVSPGYWRRPEETAEAFRDGWLYTGDLAVVDREGFVDIVDRRKDMIVCGGENVYSTEVEHALCAHPAVREAAAFGLPDPEWGEVVCAAVALRTGREASAEELVRSLRAVFRPRPLPPEAR